MSQWKRSADLDRGDELPGNLRSLRGPSSSELEVTPEAVPVTPPTLGRGLDPLHELAKRSQHVDFLGVVGSADPGARQHFGRSQGTSFDYERRRLDGRTRGGSVRFGDKPIPVQIQVAEELARPLITLQELGLRLHRSLPSTGLMLPLFAGLSPHGAASADPVDEVALELGERGVGRASLVCERATSRLRSATS